MAIFNFGKYKGLDYEEVKLIDMSYIKWCESNVEGFTQGYRQSSSLHGPHGQQQDDYDEDHQSKYAGTYAHDEGYDDFTIDNVFDGDPDMVWNVD